MANALSETLPALLVKWHWAGIFLLEQNCWALPPSPPPPPLQQLTLLTGNSRARCLPWVTSPSSWRLYNCRDANALHCNLWAGMLSRRSDLFEFDFSSVSCRRFLPWLCRYTAVHIINRRSLSFICSLYHCDTRSTDSLLRFKPNCWCHPNEKGSREIFGSKFMGWVKYPS